MITLALLNAHADLLATIVEIFTMTPSEKNEIVPEEVSTPPDIVKIILDTKFDHLPAFILALGLYPFSEPIKRRVEATISLLCDLATRSRDNAS